MLILIENFKSSKSGILCVLGAFLIQVCAGSYHGTFGNLLPYFTSYLKQVKEYIRRHRFLYANILGPFIGIENLFRSDRTSSSGSVCKYVCKSVTLLNYYTETT